MTAVPPGRLVVPVAEVVVAEVIPGHGVGVAISQGATAETGTIIANGVVVCQGTKA